MRIIKYIGNLLMFVLCALGAAEHQALHIGFIGEFALVIGAVIAFIMFIGQD